jgi:demethylspheroidene O-methyltransferase
VTARSDDALREPTTARSPQALSLADRLYAARDELLQNPEFQRFSASFPPTRPIAARQARALFDLCAGFVYSQVLRACVELSVFERLANCPMTTAELAHDLRLPEPATERLMTAACSLRLVARRSGGRFGLGMLGAALNANPGIAAMVEHHAVLYRDLADPVGVLRRHGAGTELSRYWRYAGAADPSGLASDDVAAYSALMAASQSFIADDVLAAYPFGRCRIVLDIGGGEGAFVEVAAARFPKPRFILFDLPAVADRARVRLARAQLSQRTTVVGGDFLADRLPGGADLITFVRVLHDHNDDAALALLKAARAALARGGAVLVAEPLAGTPGNEPVGDAYFGMYLLAMGQGRPRTATEIGNLLTRAGFSDVQVRKTRRPMLVGAVSARHTRNM